MTSILLPKFNATNTFNPRRRKNKFMKLKWSKGKESNNSVNYSVNDMN